jgi:hypothetical protein
MLSYTMVIFILHRPAAARDSLAAASLDHAVAVSIEAPPEAPHRNHDRHCSQEQKE